MKKLLKGVVGLLVAGVVLVAVAVVAVPLLIDADDVKNQLAEQVKRHTGRDLSIPGEVKLSVFPWLGATLGRVSLGNAPGFAAPAFASTEKVEVRVKLMPLFSRRVEMDTVVVHGLALNLERNAQGGGNWEDLAAGAPAERGARGPATPAGGGAGLAGFAIGGVDVRDGSVSYVDALAGQSYSVRNLSLTTGSVAPGRPVAVDLGFDVSSDAPPMSGRVSAQATVQADPASRVARLSGLALDARLEGAGLPGEKLALKLGADAELDGARRTLSLLGLKAELLELVVTGTLEARGLGGEPAFEGELAVAEFSPRKLLASLGQPDTRTSDDQVLRRASLKASVSGGADALALEPVALRLDDTTLNGKLGVTGFASPAVRFDLVLDAIDVDRYLPPGTEAPPASPGAAAGKAGEVPLATLRGIDAAGSVRAGKVKIARLNLSDLAATVTAKDGLIRLAPVSARLYEGSYRGNVSLDARKDTPVLGLDEKLSGVQVGPLLMDLQGEAPITGTGNVSATLAAKGADPEAIKRTLGGNASFQFLDGALQGVNIGRMIREARARLRGERLTEADAPSRTDFTEVTGTATVKGGVISNQDLSAKSPLLRIAGKGTASLPEERIDYRVTATLVATSKGQGGKELGDLAGVPVPVHVTGTFAQPEYGLDAQALAEAVAKGKAKEVVDAQKAKIEEKVGEKAGGLLGEEGPAKLLKGLFGN
jgi:AsmA protein